MYPSLLPRAETSFQTPSRHSRECGNLRGPCPTTYSWEHPSPRKVTGCIRRMVGGWRIQIPAFAGMTWGRWGCSGRHGGLVQFARSGFPLYALARVIQRSPKAGTHTNAGRNVIPDPITSFPRMRESSDPQATRRNGRKTNPDRAVSCDYVAAAPFVPAGSGAPMLSAASGAPAPSSIPSSAFSMPIR